MIWLQIIIPIVVGALLLFVVEILVEKFVTFFNEKQERKRLEEAKRYAAFFSGSDTVQR